MSSSTLSKRVLKSAIRMEGATVSEFIQRLEDSIGDSCVVIWAIEDASEENINVSFFAGITYMEVLHSIASLCDYVLLSHEEKSDSGKSIIYLSLLKRYEDKS